MRVHKSLKANFVISLLIGVMVMPSISTAGIGKVITDLFRRNSIAVRQAVSEADNVAAVATDAKSVGKRFGSRSRKAPKRDLPPLTQDEGILALHADDPINKESKGLFNDLSYLLDQNFELLETQGQKRGLQNIISQLAAGKDVLLVGKEGSGKSQHIYEVARQIRNGNAFGLSNSRVIGINMRHKNFADRSLFAQDIESMRWVVQSDKAGDPNSPLIIVFDGVNDTLIDPEKARQGYIDLATAMDDIRRQFAPRGVRFIVTGNAEQAAKIKKIPDIGGKFFKWDIAELSERQLLDMLREYSVRLESELGVIIPEDLQKKALQWARMYFPDNALPASVLAVLKETAVVKMQKIANPSSEKLETLNNELERLLQKKNTLHKLIADHPDQAAHAYMENVSLPEKLQKIRREIRTEERALEQIRQLKPDYEQLRTRGQELQREVALLQEQGKIEEVEAKTKEAQKVLQEFRKLRKRISNLTEEDLAFYISETTGIRMSDLINPAKAMSFEEAMAYFDANLFGQPELRELAELLVRRAILDAGSMNDEIRTSILILGPSGVGKTEFAKVINKIVHNKPESQMIRLDMSEYKTKESIASIIGTPPGYIGYFEGGRLVKMVAADSDRVFLLDEIEKAHPEVMDLLLQMLDNSELTALDGMVARFRNTDIIMTSNLIQDPTLDVATIKEMLIKGVESTDGTIRAIRGEILNRVKHIIVANDLSDDVLIKVGEKYVRLMNENFAKKNQKVELDPDVMAQVLEVFKSPKFGRIGAGRVFQEALQQEVYDLIDVLRMPGGAYLDKQGHTIATAINPGDIIRVFWHPERGYMIRTVSREEAVARIDLAGSSDLTAIDRITREADEAFLKATSGQL